MAWATYLQISKTDDGWFHVYCPTNGSSVEEALAAAEFVLKSLATGKLTMIRAEPQATAEQNFDTKETTFKGFVRFSFKDEPGEWKRRAKHVPSLGVIGAAA